MYLGQVTLCTVLVAIAFVAWTMSHENTEYTIIHGGGMPGPSPGNRVHIMSFNVYGLPDYIMLLRDNQTYARDIASRIESELHRYDVICLQEVFSSSIQQELDIMFGNHGWSVCRQSPTSILHIRPDSGLYIASKWKMHMIQDYTFRSTSFTQPDSLVRKGAVGVYLPDLSTRIVNVHLVDSVFDSNHVTATAQLHELRRHMGQAIYVGDFNVDNEPTRKEFGSVLGAAPVFPVQPTHRQLFTGKWDVLDGGFFPSHCKDTQVEVEPVDRSDHEMVHLSFRRV